jgi:hypothetical protein
VAVSMLLPLPGAAAVAVSRPPLGAAVVALAPAAEVSMG